MNEPNSFPAIVPDENGKIDVSALRAYIDAAVAEAVSRITSTQTMQPVSPEPSGLWADGVVAPALTGIIGAPAMPTAAAPPIAMPAAPAVDIAPQVAVAPVTPIAPPAPQVRPIAPQIFTAELSGLWMTEEYKPAEVQAAAPQATPFAPSQVALAGSPIPEAATPAPAETPISVPVEAAEAAATTEKTEKAFRFGFKKKLSLFIIGVIAIAISAQILSANGIVDFSAYTKLTETVFGNIF